MKFFTNRNRAKAYARAIPGATISELLDPKTGLVIGYRVTAQEQNNEFKSQK